MMLSISFNDDCLDTSIHHQSLDQFIISLELLLDVLKLSTFYDMNCRIDQCNFNASKIMQKYEDLTQQMR